MNLVGLLLHNDNQMFPRNRKQRTEIINLILQTGYFLAEAAMASYFPLRQAGGYWKLPLGTRFRLVAEGRGASRAF